MARPFRIRAVSKRPLISRRVLPEAYPGVEIVGLLLRAESLKRTPA